MTSFHPTYCSVNVGNRHNLSSLIASCVACRDCFKKFWGWVPEHGVLRGLPLSEWRKKFFERLGQKKTPTHFFHFFKFRPRGWTMPPQKMVRFLTFLTNSRKIKGVKYKGAPCTRSISVVDPTLRWGRVSPPSPKFFGEPKQIFEISATLELPAAKTLRCIRTKLSGFVDMWEVNKSP